jgi:hypothetical protein
MRRKKIKGLSHRYKAVHFAEPPAKLKQGAMTETPKMKANEPYEKSRKGTRS